MSPIKAYPQEPMRMPARTAAQPAIRIDARRQLRQSLWLMGVISVAFVAVFAARPMGPVQIHTAQHAPAQ